ncbi:MAG: creatininase family protein [Candidatus Aminicenantes bacterium]|nr:creatininase family protein [Candidatus Aminicenantes bacterium]
MNSKTTRFLISILFLWLWIILHALFISAEKQPSPREMNMMTWKQFQECVPGQIETVLLPVGSLEPHGVIPNGTDNLAPQVMSQQIAQAVNALIAPTLNYGVTPRMKAYAGAVSVNPESYQPFVEDILIGLAEQGFKNIIVLNGHGGNTKFLHQAVLKVSSRCKVRILVVNWWSLASDETQEVFGESGGHAGNNETAYIQAVFPEHIHPEQYHDDMATVNARGDSWYAVPVPSSIGLYEKGQGCPTFDKKQAQEYFQKVNHKVASFIKEMINKWDMADLYR